MCKELQVLLRRISVVYNQNRNHLCHACLFFFQLLSHTTKEGFLDSLSPAEILLLMPSPLFFIFLHLCSGFLLSFLYSFPCIERWQDYRLTKHVKLEAGGPHAKGAAGREFDMLVNSRPLRRPQ